MWIGSLNLRDKERLKTFENKLKYTTDELRRRVDAVKKY
jgi:hypothetical protein